MLSAHAQSRQRVRIFLWIILGLVVFAVGFSAVYRAAWDDIQRTDYTVYTAAGQAVLDHTDIYRAHNARGWSYVYPPPFALLLAPLARLPGTLGALLWYLLEIGSLVATSWMAVFMLKRDIPDHHKDLLYALPILSLATLLVSGAMRCQASGFMIALMVAAFHWHFRGKPVFAGLSLAAATVLKVFPITLLLYFIARRQWRTVMVTLGGIVLLMLLPALFWGWHTNLDMIARWTDVVGRTALISNPGRALASPLFGQLLDAYKPRNQSLEALLLSASLSPALVKYGVVLCATLMMAAMLLASKAVVDTTTELALASAFMVWTLLVPPVSETHYFGALIMPITTLLGLILYGSLDRHRQRWGIITLGAVMIGVMFLIGWETTAVLRPLCLASLLLWGVLTGFVVRYRPLALMNAALHDRAGLEGADNAPVAAVPVIDHPDHTAEAERRD
ncbi:MAG TPA: glycosyltransferase family 87 protein [Moraxellaceae bacterium]|nr:glycosyltransferase family 87 protein [Moraxellaceae bacterium]